MEDNIIIKVNGKEYRIDRRLEHFMEAGKPDGKCIPVSKFRFQDGDWYVLFDKKNDTYYELGDNQQSLPLTVAWIKVSFGSQDQNRERLELIIMLLEAIENLRTTAAEGELKRVELSLRKSVASFLNRNE